MRLHLSTSLDIHVGANAVADTFVVLPFPEDLSDSIYFEMGDMPDLELNSRQTIYANAFWSNDISDQNSLIVFASEYKRGDNTRNKNQLGIDFGAAQSQRRALGLNDAIIWGTTCSNGVFEVFSSQWRGRVKSPFLSTHHAVHHFYLGHLICASS